MIFMKNEANAQKTPHNIISVNYKVAGIAD